MKCLVVSGQESSRQIQLDEPDRYGLELIHIEDLRQARAELEFRHPDCLVVELDGNQEVALDFFREVRSRGGFDSMILTALVEAGDSVLKLKALEAGASCFMNKPFRVEELTRVLSGCRQRGWANLNAGSEKYASTREDPKSDPQSSEELFGVLDWIKEPVCLLENGDKVQYVNEAFRLFTGYTRPDLNDGKGMIELMSRPQSWGLIMKDCSEKGTWKGELELRLRNSMVATVLCRVDRIQKYGSSKNGKILTFVDISERKKLERELLFLVNYDSLTGLSNRRCFSEILDAAVFKAKREGGVQSCLLYLDLDNFKVVNDSAGHAAGDRLLLEISQILKRQTNEAHSIARFGGDEFTILIEDTTLGRALDTARRLVKHLDDYRFVYEEKVFSASVSVGVAFIDGSCSSDEVLSRADLACYNAKEKGRNGYSVYKPDAAEIHKLNVDAAWSITIRDAIKEKRFELWLQPIRKCGTSENTYFEVLIRMRDSKGNLVLPGAFLPAAERFGLMDQVDAYVVRNAIVLLSEYNQLKLSINLSAKSLNNPALPGVIERWFREMKVDPQRAVFEITETDIIKNMAHAKELINRVRNLGSRFALDDFGAGASSMSYLKDLPVDIVKIDGSFIKDIAKDQINRAIVTSINEVAHILGRKTVAEFVANEDVYKVIQEIGVDYGQGFYLCAPSPATSFFPKQRD